MLLSLSKNNKNKFKEKRKRKRKRKINKKRQEKEQRKNKQKKYEKNIIIIKQALSAMGSRGAGLYGVFLKGIHRQNIIYYHL